MTLEDRIKKAFKISPELKDNPEALCLAVWRDSLPIQFGALPVRNFLSKVIAGEIDMPNLLAIDRVRRQLQQMNPEYEGRLREKRKQKSDRINLDYQNSKIEKLL